MSKENAMNETPRRLYWAIDFEDSYHIVEKDHTPGGSSKYTRGDAVGYVFGWYSTFADAWAACENRKIDKRLAKAEGK